jgi:hypothetical protein
MTAAYPAGTCTAARRIFTSGQPVPPGIYRCLFTGQEVRPNNQGHLPILRGYAPTLYVRLTRSVAQSAIWGMTRRAPSSNIKASAIKTNG